MENPGDIYRKANRPYHVSRRSRQLLARQGVAPAPVPDENPAVVRPEGPPRGDPSLPRSHVRRRRRNVFHSLRRRYLSGRLNNLLVAFSLIMGGVMMLVVLSHFLRYRSDVRRQLRAEEAPAPAPKSASTNAIPAELPERIAAWRQLPDRLAEAEGLRMKNLADQAEAHLRTALESNPASAALHLALARQLADNARPADAVAHLVESLNAQPADTGARLLLAETLESLGEYELCGQVAEWMLESDPYSAEAHRVAASAFLKSEQPRAAIPHLRKVVNLELDSLDVQNDLAEAYSRAGEYDKALTTLESILQQEPAHPSALFTLAVCYARQAKTNEVLATVQRASALVGTNAVNQWMSRPELQAWRTGAVETTADPDAGP